jgi:hypothetical protein
MRTREQRREALRVARTTRHVQVDVAIEQLPAVVADLGRRYRSLTMRGMPPDEVKVEGGIALPGSITFESCACVLSFDPVSPGATRITATVPDSAVMASRWAHLGVHRLFAAIRDEIDHRAAEGASGS